MSRRPASCSRGPPRHHGCLLPSYYLRGGHSSLGPGDLPLAPLARPGTAVASCPTSLRLLPAGFAVDAEPPAAWMLRCWVRRSRGTTMAVTARHCCLPLPVLRPFAHCGRLRFITLLNAAWSLLLPSRQLCSLVAPSAGSGPLVLGRPSYPNG